MACDRVAQLISDTTVETYNANAEYLKESHLKEMESVVDEHGKIELVDALAVMSRSVLRSAIELSTVNTLKVLEELGVEVPGLGTQKNCESP